MNTIYLRRYLHVELHQSIISCIKAIKDHMLLHFEL